MRHKKIGRRLGRNSSHRKAMYRNMAASLIEFESISTTLPKAKELRRTLEPLITLAKEDGVSRRRMACSRNTPVFLSCLPAFSKIDESLLTLFSH